MLIFLLALTDTDTHDRILHIYHHYHQDMLRYAAGLLERTSGAYDAEDVVQNTYVSVYQYIRNIDFWEDERRLRRYLLSCVRHEAVKLQKSAPWCEELDTHVNVLLSDDDFVRKINEAEDYRRLVESIRRLHDRYGHLMYLHWVDELSVHEIAARMEMKPTTVYKDLERGKLMLIKALEGEVPNGTERQRAAEAGADRRFAAGRG